MRSTLAVYVTLFAVAVVAVAQILYWKLVIARDPAPGAADAPDPGWPHEPMAARQDLPLEDSGPRPGAEPLYVEEPAPVATAA
ncbi:MAG: hypothetical protein ACJ780_26380 [Solirubrobacteraceae bacterium]